MGSTLALSVAITRKLGATALGEQSLVAYVSSMMVSVVIYSFTVASVQLMADAGGTGDEARLAHLLRWSFYAHLLGGTVAAVSMTAIGFTCDSYHALWFLAAVTAIADAVGWAYASRSISAEGWGPTSTRRLAAQAAGPLLGIVAIYGGLGVSGLFGAQLAVSVALAVFLCRHARKLQTPSWRDCAALPWLPVLRTWSLFALSFLIAQVVERRIELVFLDRYHDAVSVAMFSVAFNVVGIPVMIVTSVVGAAMPAIAARYTKDPDLVVRTIGRAARIVVALGLVLVGGTISVGPTLVTSVYGAEFAPAAGLLRWLAFSLLVSPLTALCTALWTGTGRLRPVLLAGCVAAGVDIVAAWCLVPPLGPAGAVVATISAQAVMALLIVTHTVRKGPRLNLRPSRLVRTAIVVLIACVAAHAAGALTGGGWSAIPAVILGFGATAVVGSRLVGFVDADDLEWLARSLPERAGRVLLSLSPRR